MSTVNATIPATEETPEPWRLESEPLGIPQVLLWARVTGRRLSPTLSLILREMAYFADRNGYLQPSQYTLATNTNFQRGTVSDAIKKLKALGYVETFIRDDLEGHHLRYRLTGADDDWDPEPPVAQRSFETIVCEVVDELREEVRYLAEKVTSLDPTFSLPPKRRRGAHKGSRQYSTSHFPSDETTTYGTVEPNVSETDISFSLELKPEIEEWVDQHWESIKESRSNPKGWRMRSRAIQWYLENPGRWQEQSNWLEDAVDVADPRDKYLRAFLRIRGEDDPIDDET